MTINRRILLGAAGRERLACLSGRGGSLYGVCARLSCANSSKYKRSSGNDQVLLLATRFGWPKAWTHGL